MSDDLERFEELAETLSTAPSLAEMPRRTLADKGIAGPTAAHVIEEVHTPFNLAYLTFTTGSSAFQNIVGVVHSEIEGRCDVARRLFQALGIAAGRHMLVTYAPLVNVFSKTALERSGITWNFLSRSSRDAFIARVCRDKPDVILGESSFIRASLAEAKRLGFAGELPRGCVILTAGTPLDLELLEEAESLGCHVHDLYGCQEFGWLTLDGVPLRDDVALVGQPTQVVGHVRRPASWIWRVRAVCIGLVVRPAVVSPASTTSVWPVTYRDSSLARYTAAAAMSSGKPA